MGFFGQIHCALGGVVDGIFRGLAAFYLRSLGIDLLINALEAPPSVAQKDEPEHRHAILLARELRVRAKLVRRFPKLSFQFGYIGHIAPFEINLYSPIIPKRKRVHSSRL